MPYVLFFGMPVVYLMYSVDVKLDRQQTLRHGLSSEDFYRMRFAEVGKLADNFPPPEFLGMRPPPPPPPNQKSRTGRIV
jgi:hypothetical protein